MVIATGYPKPGNRNDCTVYRDSGIADTLADTASGIAHLHNLALTG